MDLDLLWIGHDTQWIQSGLLSIETHLVSGKRPHHLKR